MLLWCKIDVETDSWRCHNDLNTVYVTWKQIKKTRMILMILLRVFLCCLWKCRTYVYITTTYVFLWCTIDVDLLVGPPIPLHSISKSYVNYNITICPDRYITIWIMFKSCWKNIKKHVLFWWYYYRKCPHTISNRIREKKVKNRKWRKCVYITTTHVFMM